MSIWEFGAAFGGYVKANSTEEKGAITSEEAKALAAFIDEPPVWH
jgi:hypothetical protein